MIASVTFSDFVDRFRNMGRGDQFGYHALRALFDYLEESEEDCGVAIPLDVIGLCCEWTEYATAAELLREHLGESGAAERIAAELPGGDEREDLEEAAINALDRLEEREGLLILRFHSHEGGGYLIHQ